MAFDSNELLSDCDLLTWKRGSHLRLYYSASNAELYRKRAMLLRFADGCINQARDQSAKLVQLLTALRRMRRNYFVKGLRSTLHQAHHDEPLGKQQTW
jgi:hypothetical protein